MAEKRFAKNTEQLLKALEKIDPKEYMDRARQAVADKDWDLAAATLAALAFAHKPVYDMQRKTAFHAAKRYLIEYEQTPEYTLKHLVKSPIARARMEELLGI